MGVHRSRSCVCNWVKALGYSRQKASMRTVKADSAQERKMWAMRYTDEWMNETVMCVDETAFYLDCYPQTGYSQRGTRLHVTEGNPLPR